MKKIYNRPATEVAQIASMSLMQVTSPAGPARGDGQLNAIETDSQW